MTAMPMHRWTAGRPELIQEMTKNSSPGRVPGRRRRRPAQAGPPRGIAHLDPAGGPGPARRSAGPVPAAAADGRTVARGLVAGGRARGAGHADGGAGAAGVPGGGTYSHDVTPRMRLAAAPDLEAPEADAALAGVSAASVATPCQGQ